MDLGSAMGTWYVEHNGGGKTCVGAELRCAAWPSRRRCTARESGHKGLR